VFLRGIFIACIRYRTARLSASILYRRSSSAFRIDVSFMPMLLRIVPDRNPRNEWACHLVALISSLIVAPSGRRKSLRIFALLLPARKLTDFSDRAAFWAAFFSRTLADPVATERTFQAAVLSALADAYRFRRGLFFIRI